MNLFFDTVPLASPRNWKASVTETKTGPAVHLAYLLYPLTTQTTELATLMATSVYQRENGILVTNLAGETPALERRI